MFALFFTALLLGFIFNAAPGAVFAETIRQGIRGGFKGALAVQIGSLVGDALSAVLGLAGVGLLLQWDLLRLPIGIAGVLYLLWLARDTWQEANKEVSIKLDRTNTHSKNALLSGILLSITNPQVAAIAKMLDKFNLLSLCHCLFSLCSFLATKPLEFIRISSRFGTASSNSQRTLTRLSYVGNAQNIVLD
jgi:arginine exporter protein ArgO